MPASSAVARTAATSPGPLVVFEVLSEETELVDRSDKRREYQAIPSLAHYVLVSQDVLRPEIYSRREGQWLFTELEGSETVVTLDPPGIEFPLGELYVGLDLADADRDELSADVLTGGDGGTAARLPRRRRRPSGPPAAARLDAAGGRHPRTEKLLSLLTERRREKKPRSIVRPV